MKLYTQLASFYSLVDPVEDHEEEMLAYQQAMARAGLAGGDLLELGAGAGHNAHFLKRNFRCTLTDIAEPMLALSRRRNPECEHVVGDMRTLRLQRRFDAVVVHDAICHMLTVQDVSATLRTAAAHLRPGGIVIAAPDCVLDTFRPASSTHENADAGREVRWLEWCWDPDPTDSTYQCDYAFLLRDAQGMRCVHDFHREGLFAKSVWLEMVDGAGFDASVFPRPIEVAVGEGGGVDRPPAPYAGEVFFGRLRGTQGPL